VAIKWGKQKAKTGILHQLKVPWPWGHWHHRRELSRACPMLLFCLARPSHARHGYDQASGWWNFVSCHFKLFVTVLWAINHEINMQWLSTSTSLRMTFHKTTTGSSKKVLITWLIRKHYSIKLLLEFIHILELRNFPMLELLLVLKQLS
jgi:hypothetical protein